MKPTYGAVSRYGLVAFASSLDQIGPITTTVADSALVFDVISGWDPLDSTCLDRPGSRCTAALTEGVEGLRVGVLTELVDGVDAAVATRVREAADALARAGATVEDRSVPQVRLGLPAYYILAPAEASSNLARYDGVRYGVRVDADDVETMMSATRAVGFGPEVKRRIMLGTYALSAGYYDAYYGQAQKVRTLIADALAAAYEQFDVLIGATTPTTAFAIGDKVDDPWAMYLSDVCTVPSNLAGHPAVSVPFGADSEGLPIGVQVLAPPLEESTMYRAAAVVEDVAPRLASPAVSVR
jgi:aspartyl-tRNA(Asn)/glutamyl-tRNA(Gln) amidotransferase subunit A